MRVLLVDHDADFAEVMELLLTQEGYEVRAADSVFTLTRELSKFRPAAVIVDFGWTVRRALELGRRIRLRASCGLIGLTSSPLSMEDAESACFDHIFMKPVDFVSLREALNQCRVRAGQ